jgi:hypothetical protein
MDLKNLVAAPRKQLGKLFYKSAGLPSSEKILRRVTTLVYDAIRGIIVTYTAVP